MFKEVVDEVKPAGARSRTGDFACGCFVQHAGDVIFLPAVFENKQDVIPEGVSVLFQDSTHIIKHLHQNTSQR